MAKLLQGGCNVHRAVRVEENVQSVELAGLVFVVFEMLKNAALKLALLPHPHFVDRVHYASLHRVS
jgi:hypothetical protein